MLNDLQRDIVQRQEDEAAARRRERYQSMAAEQDQPAQSPAAPAQSPAGGQIGGPRIFGMEVPPGPQTGTLRFLARAVPDVAVGARETISLQAPGHGVIDGANATLDFVDYAGDAIGNLVGFNPRLTFINPETGRFDLGVAWTNEQADEFRNAIRDRLLAEGVGAEEAQARADASGTLDRIPQVFNEPTSVTGNLVEGISQFLTGWATGGAALKAARLPQGINWATRTGRAALQGFIADFTAFEGAEGNLSDLIQSAPALQNPITEFLSTDEESPEIVNRLRTAIEGLGVGIAADAIIGGLRSMKAASATRATAEAELASLAREDEAARVAFERDIVSIGDPAAPAVTIAPREGRTATTMVDQMISDIREGRRGLDPQEAEHLLGAAERWARSVARLQPERGASLNDRISEAAERVNQGDYDAILSLMEEARKPTFNAPSLFDFVREQGGLRPDEGGELLNMDLRPRRYRGDRPVSTNTGIEVLDEQSGLDLDEMTLRAWEAGYFPGRQDRPTVNEFLDLARRESQGDRVYAEANLDDVNIELERRAMFEQLEREGLDANVPIAERRAQAAARASFEPGEPITMRDLEQVDAEMDAAGAKYGVALPGGELRGGNEIRINFNALRAPDDIRSIIGQLADAFSGEVERARGVVRGVAQVMQDRKMTSAWDALANRRTGQALADNEVVAAQALYIASGQNVKNTLRHAMEANTPEAHFAARRALAVHRAIQAEIAGAKADAGRALRAWGFPVEVDAAARREMEDILTQHGGQIPERDLARLRALAEADPEGLDRAARFQSIGQVVTELGSSWIRFAFLSGPATHIMNLAGNSLTMAYDTVPRLLNGAWGRAIGDPEMARQLGSVLAEYSGFAAAIKAQFRAFARSGDYANMGRNLNEIWSSVGQPGGRSRSRALRDTVALPFQGRFDDMGVAGNSKFAEGGNTRALSAERFGISEDNPWSLVIDGLGTIFSAPTDFLGFADDFFKGVNFLGSVHRQAFDRAAAELDAGAVTREQFQERYLHYIENPDGEMQRAARQDAQRRTFTEPVGKGTRAAMSLRRWMNVGGLPFGHLVLPFIVTPSNILKFSFQNSPAGVLFRGVRDELRAGGQRAQIARARMLGGLGLLMVGMDYAANGQITGAAPTDQGERALWERLRIQPYSIKVGDAWVSYRRLEPVSTMMALGADLHHIMSNLFGDDAVDDVEQENLWMTSAAAAMQVVMDKTFLTGAAEFFNLAENPQMTAPSFGRNLMGALAVPAFVSQIERQMDPIVRDAQTIMDRIRARTPGLSDDLPPQYDLWGRVRSTESGVGRLYDALSPFSIRIGDPEPIDRELYDIGYYPRLPSRNITVPIMSGEGQGTRVSINLRNRPDIYARYVQLAGNEGKYFAGRGARDYLNDVVEGRDRMSQMYLNQFSTTGEGRGTRAGFIEEQIDLARTRAQFQLRREYQADLDDMARATLEAQRRAETYQQQRPSLIQ